MNSLALRLLFPLKNKAVSYNERVSLFYNIDYMSKTTEMLLNKESEILITLNTWVNVLFLLFVRMEGGSLKSWLLDGQL